MLNRKVSAKRYQTQKDIILKQFYTKEKINFKYYLKSIIGGQCGTQEDADKMAPNHNIA